MEEKHRKLIQTNFNSLVEQTDLDPVVSLLYEKGVFSQIMIEPYQDTNIGLRHRKRMLYRDIERRGPLAFGHLVDTLRDTGHWNLVRMLAPDSIIRPHMPTISLHPPKKSSPSTASSSYASSTSTPRLSSRQPSPPPPPPSRATFKVVGSHKWATDENCYVTRSRHRGIALIITIYNYDDNIADPRSGADADHANLKELFLQIGFHKIVAYTNVTYEEMKEIIKSFTQLDELERTECVFVVIGSHGYARLDTNDVDIRCKDGRLISTYSILGQFNNQNCPKLHNIPKVFMFQSCRGNERDTREKVTSRLEFEQPPETDGATPLPPDRLYSDMLIAHATIPGFVSYRDRNQGSWYIQCVCHVFAARAHDTHVDDLMTLVDERLRTEFSNQTSSVDRWGFNKRLYLHPQLFDNAKS